MYGDARVLNSRPVFQFGHKLSLSVRFWQHQSQDWVFFSLWAISGCQILCVPLDTSAGERKERRGRRALSQRRMNGGLLLGCRMLPDTPSLLTRSFSEGRPCVTLLFKSCHIFGWSLKADECSSVMMSAAHECPVQNTFSFYLQSSACVCSGLYHLRMSFNFNN